MDGSKRVSLMWEEVPKEDLCVQLGDDYTHSHTTVIHNCPHHFLDNPTFW